MGEPMNIRTGMAPVLALLLAACGGGSGSDGGDSSAMIDRERAVDRLERIVEEADTVLASRIFARYTIREGFITVSDDPRILLTCSGRECTGSDGFSISVEEVFESDADLDLGLDLSTIAARGGFHTGSVDVNLDDLLNDFLEDPALTVIPRLELFGAWGEHGAAAVMLMTGSIRGEYEGIPFRGNLQFATHIVLGTATKTDDPTGLGSATWRGVAEAVSTTTFARSAGTASITIPDLSNPLVNASIALDGREIGAWMAMPLHQGQYESGQPGSGSHLIGSFHGPGHEETYGVFDTGRYLGSYGAMRD